MPKTTPHTPSELTALEMDEAKVAEVVAEVMESEGEEEDREPIAVNTRRDWVSPWGVKYTFIMPSGDAYRRLVKDRQVTVVERGFVLNPAMVEPLFKDYVTPRPDPKNMTPGQWDRLCFEFIGFLQRVR